MKWYRYWLNHGNATFEVMSSILLKKIEHEVCESVKREMYLVELIEDEKQGKKLQKCIYGKEPKILSVDQK